uniref:Uncharacterized protein n=1 Tax=Sphaeramia orbicularis TaxID=375764 RepID=A0A672YRS0_9TELE
MCSHGSTGASKCPAGATTLTEISDDEVNLPPSDDEDDALAAAKKICPLWVQRATWPRTRTKRAKLDPQVNGVMVCLCWTRSLVPWTRSSRHKMAWRPGNRRWSARWTTIQGELIKLAKSHSTTSNSVNKMMEKVRKVSVNVKTVRANLEKQGGQIKKLENNEAELLKRRNFKVMIYQVGELTFKHFWRMS